MFAPVILEVRKIKLFHVRPIQLIPWLRELLGAGIHVKAIRQTVSHGLHMTAHTVGCFEYGHIVSSPRQFVSTAKACDSTTCDNHFLGSLSPGRFDLSHREGHTRCSAEKIASSHHSLSADSITKRLAA